LFAFVSGFTGATAALTSMVAAALLSHSALFVGAILGGLAGVAAAVRLSAALQLLAAPAVWPGTFGGWIGFLIAAPLAVANAHTQVIPLLSVAFVGAGTLVLIRITRGTQKP